MPLLHRHELNSKNQATGLGWPMGAKVYNQTNSVRLTHLGLQASFCGGACPLAAAIPFKRFMISLAGSIAFFNRMGSASP